MTFSNIAREVLELAEEDYYGLWEIGWHVRTVLGLDPTIEPSALATAIEAMLSGGLIDIFVREWSDDDPLPIRSTGHSVNLRDPMSWSVPERGAPQFLVGALASRDD